MTVPASESSGAWARWRAAPFYVWVAACAGAYVAVQFLLLRRLPLVMDEFDGAYDAYLLRDRVPYVDFRPYKTVLGYYVQLPALAFAPDVWSGLVGTKALLAVVNAVSLVVAAVGAARLFPRPAVALALPLWVAMTNWLERSSELRVDAMTSFCGLFSLLCLLAGRAGLAGVLAALSFLVSQKGIYFFAAGGAALLARAAVAPAGERRLAPLGRFGAAYAGTLAPYLVLFGALASWRATTDATFLAHRAIVLSEIYPEVRKYWTQSLERNPAFYALGLAGLVVLGVAAARGLRRRERGREEERDFHLFVYGAVLGACLVWHKQPWPYFFVLLAPTAFVVHAGAFARGWRLLRTRVPPGWRRAAIGVPIVACLFWTGVVVPASRIPALLRHDNAYQRHMVELASAMLAPGERYLAGVDLLYDRPQSSAMLRRVSFRRRAELRAADAKLVARILAELRRDPPKLLVVNERFRAFPPLVSRYLAAYYAPFWGGIRVYAPRFGARSRSVNLRFPGIYRVATVDASRVQVDGREVASGASVTLGGGRVGLVSASAGRLVLTVPDVESRLDPRFRAQRRMFRRVYSR